MMNVTLVTDQSACVFREFLWESKTTVSLVTDTVIVKTALSFTACLENVTKYSFVQVESFRNQGNIPMNVWCVCARACV